MDTYLRFSMFLQVIETGASLVTALSLLAIAVHEITSNGWRDPIRRKRRK